MAGNRNKKQSDAEDVAFRRYASSHGGGGDGIYVTSYGSRLGTGYVVSEYDEWSESSIPVLVFLTVPNEVRSYGVRDHQVFKVKRGALSRVEGKGRIAVLGYIEWWRKNQDGKVA